tara:strand:+ start:73784 stop:74449 length:666 start_codon:yes stop_codon:yes gene_type:complete
LAASKQDTISQLRIPTHEEMHKFWDNPDLTYNEDVTPQSENIIAYLFRKFFEWLEDLFGKAHVDTAWTYIEIILVLFLVYFVLTRIFKFGLFNIFSKKNKKTANQVILNDWQEDIHAINFDDKINQALKDQNYREAIRLRFLKVLKLLTDNDYIHWSIEKTNRDYLNEMSNKQLKEPFEKTVLIFDYVWYGEFDIETHDDYVIFEQQFIAAEKSLNNREKN